MLPNFVHIGSAKAASTLLWEICKEHPEIYVPKDWDNPNFFTVHYHRGIEWYEKYYFGNVGKEKAIVDFSNSYIVFPPAIERVARHLPGAKLTVTLRNPVERTYRSWAASHYQGKWGLNPAKGIGIPFDRLLHPNGTSYFRAWVDPGFYASHLSRVFQFFSRDSVFIMLYDDLTENPSLFLKRYFEFMGVDPDFSSLLLSEDINADTKEAHQGEGMTPEMRSELHKVFKDDIARLEDILGRDLSHWR